MTRNEKEIQHAASTMVERYGSDALKEVDLRILELESRDEQEAVELWREIRKIVSLWSQKTPSSGIQ